MKLSLLLALLVAIVPAASSAATSAPAAPRPNILIIVADDLGWGAVGWHGSHIKTPHLDKLVRAGVELDQHDVSPMCSPTRGAIVSGRYASRFGVTGAQNGLAYFPRYRDTRARFARSRLHDCHHREMAPRLES